MPQPCTVRRKTRNASSTRRVRGHVSRRRRLSHAFARRPNHPTKHLPLHSSTPHGLHPHLWTLILDSRVGGLSALFRGGQAKGRSNIQTGVKHLGTKASWHELQVNRYKMKIILVKTSHTKIRASRNVCATARMAARENKSCAVVGWQGSTQTRATHQEVIQTRVKKCECYCEDGVVPRAGRC